MSRFYFARRWPLIVSPLALLVIGLIRYGGYLPDDQVVVHAIVGLAVGISICLEKEDWV